MSIVPQRPPDTPLLSFYATGACEQRSTRARVKHVLAEPGAAATKQIRNSVEGAVKSVT
jgi:hypothetical protein